VKDRPLLSRILAALGALLLLSAPVTLLFFSGIGPDGKLSAVGWVAAAKAAIGAGLVALAVLAGSPGGARRFFTGRAAHYGFFTAVSALLVAATLAIANWIAWVRPKSWDLTRDRIFTLAPDTVQTLGRLDRDVRALAFYREDEADLAPAEDLFRRYAALSPRFRFEIVDPYRSPELVKRYEVTERSARIVLVAGDRVARVKAPTEEALTNGLVELAGVARRKVYFLGGHGEPSPEDASGAGYATAAEGLREDGFDVATLSLLEQREVPADASVVLVAGPRTPLLAPEVKALEGWLAKGGKLGIYLEPAADAGLDALLAAWGIEAGNDLVVDPSPVSSLFGGSASTPLVTPTGDHPVARGLENVGLAFPTARSLVGLSKVSPPPTPLALTAASAWAETDVKGAFATGSARQDPGEKSGPFPVAFAAVRPAEGGKGEARMVVVGDSEFFDDQYQQVLGNRDFFLNGVAWLGERADRITIRPRSREPSRLTLSDAQVSVIRFLTVDALPLALLGAGLAVWLVRRAR
jgi:ABC-type uncharacterized transport system involved in gliding motility auxiliary subunit